MDVKKNGEVSFWHADMGGVPAYRPPLPGDIDVDVCVVGAGYTGLWTAYYLTELDPSLRIAVIEKEFAGFGASGRNGGWCLGDFSWNRDRYLSTGTRESVIDFESQLRAAVPEIKRVTEKEGIDCDFLMTDALTFSQTPAQWDRLREMYELAMSWSVPKERLELIDGREATARIRVPDANGALVKHGVARVQPAKLARGLADVVEARGVPIYEKTTVTGIGKGIVTTDRGRVRARRIVRATEGYTHGIRGCEREWVPMNSAVMATEPVPDALWDEIGWKGNELLTDASHIYCYVQRTREGRIVIGGRGVPYRLGSRTDVDGVTDRTSLEQLERLLHRVLPQARSLRIDHAWCGVFGVPRDWCTTAGMDPETGIGWAGGYVATGVSTANFAGQTLADLVLDRESVRTALPWINRRPRKWEVEPLRWLGIRGMYRLYHMADKAEARTGGSRTSVLATVANKLTGR